MEHLRDELRHLDLLISRRLSQTSPDGRPAPETQVTRSMYVAADEVEWLLASDRSSTDGCSGPNRPDADSSPDAADCFRDEICRRVGASRTAGVTLTLPMVGERFGLSQQEIQALVICLAPELRRKYDRLYAFLQDDITRKRPSVDLVLELICAREEERWRCRQLFDTGPLIRHGLLRRTDDPLSPSGSSGLAQLLTLDQRIRQFILEADPPGGSGPVLVRLYEAAGEPVRPAIDPGVLANIESLVDNHRAGGPAAPGALALYLQGPTGVGKREIAEYLCRRRGEPMVSVDVAALVEQGDGEQRLRMALREAVLYQAPVYVAGADALLTDAARPLLTAALSTLAEYCLTAVLGGRGAWTAPEAVVDVPVRLHAIEVPIPRVSTAAEAWRKALTGRVSEPNALAGQLSARFRMTPAQIRAAVESAECHRLMYSPLSPRLVEADVAAACRRQFGVTLGDLIVKVFPRRQWEDLVLPTEAMTQLRELCDQVRHHHQVFQQWGFDGRLSQGRGLSALFNGPPGTGKTLAAEVIARHLGFDLYKADLSGVVSKYIGETEKNLSRVFRAARDGNAVLLFDEADALFGKRSEVSDAHDRFANIETSYLLQRMEQHEGIVILTTNLRQNMDEAFTRRIGMIVDFPFPEAEIRLRIWLALLPERVPLAEGIDFEHLARRLPVAGGSIKNIVLSAAFLAAADGVPLGESHILRSAQREFKKMGRPWSG